MYTTQYQYGKRMDSRLNFGEKVPKKMKSNIWMIYPSAWKWDTLNGIKTSEVPYRNGVKHGMAIENFEDGSPLNRVHWVDGEKEGKELRFQKMEINFVKKLCEWKSSRHGNLFRRRFKESEYFFENGILQGVAFRYLEDGSVVEDTWEDGKKVSSTLLPPKQNSVAKKNLPISTTKDASDVTKGD